MPPANRFEGKQKLLALGACPVVSLADAREAREGAKRLLAKGLDIGFSLIVTCGNVPARGGTRG